MIEQLVSLAASQGLNGLDASNSANPLSVNTNDVMKFNRAMMDQKVENTTLLDVSATKKNNGFLQVQQLPERNIILKIDQDYKSILTQMKDVSQFDKLFDIKKADKTPVFRSNVTTVAESPDTKKWMENSLVETKEFYQRTAEASKQMSHWATRTRIWLANVKIVSAIVKQTGSAFKTLFHSAG